jgi:NAD+ diphosphatase
VSGIVFSGNPLDRASNQRRDADWVAARLAEPAARVLPLHRLRPMVTDAPSLGWLDVPALQPAIDRLGAEAPIFLGLADGVPCFALGVSDPALEELAASLEAEGRSWGDPRAIAPLLPPGDAGVLAQARSVLDWHARHGFCAACGATTAPRTGGASRGCATCGASHFPRTDPVVIMLVEHEDRCLLAHGAGRPGNFHSALAGFIEPGESIEEAVQREVWEEAGVRVRDVRYFASQPWPFPASLMIGCFARAEGDHLDVDQEELETARWFTRAEIAAALAAGGAGEGYTLPQPVAIAHHLVRAWCEGRS